jgi:hypothetical protein
MAHKECHGIGQWVSNNVSQQLERCVEQDCNWWCLCCNKWFCFLVWVIVTVVSWVVTTVCEIVADVVDLVVNIVKGLVDIVVGIVTGDWTRVLAGLVPSEAEVITYLRSLDRKQAVGAEESVRRTPTQIRTKCRGAIEAELG